jgi:hypothetical protein
MKVVVTGRPYGVAGGKGDAVVDAVEVVAVVADAVVADAVVELLCL